MGSRPALPRLHDAADHDAIGEHVKVVLPPFARGTARRCALEDDPADRSDRAREPPRRCGRACWRARLPACCVWPAHRDRTAWLTMQSEAKRFSRPVLPAICDLQGDFQKLQGEAIRWHSNFVMVSRGCKGFSLLSEQGAFFGICREEQRGIASGGRVWRRFLFALVGAASEGGDMAPCPAAEFPRAYRLARNQGRFLVQAFRRQRLT